MTTIYAEAAEWVQSALPPNSSHLLLVACSDRHDPTTKDGSRRIKGKEADCALEVREARPVYSDEVSEADDE